MPRPVVGPHGTAHHRDADAGPPGRPASHGGPQVTPWSPRSWPYAAPDGTRKKVDRELRPVEPTRCVIPACRGRRQPHAHRRHRDLRGAAAAATATSSTWSGASSRSFPATGRWSGSCPLDLGRPVWVDDQHFNIDYHLRHTALPAPGGETELRALVGRVMAQQLDRSKPLWEIWMVEGLGGGRWALLSKTHHALVDGVSGTDLLAVIMDTTPQPSPPDRRRLGAPPRTQRRQPGPRSRHRPGPQPLRAAPRRAGEHPCAAPRAVPGRRGGPRACRRWPA